jgi:hypothetical protein
LILHYTFQQKLSLKCTQVLTKPAFDNLDSKHLGVVVVVYAIVRFFFFYDDHLLCLFTLSVKPPVDVALGGAFRFVHHRRWFLRNELQNSRWYYCFWGFSPVREPPSLCLSYLLPGEDLNPIPRTCPPPLLALYVVLFLSFDGMCASHAVYKGGLIIPRVLLPSNNCFSCSVCVCE